MSLFAASTSFTTASAVVLARATEGSSFQAYRAGKRSHRASAPSRLCVAGACRPSFVGTFQGLPGLLPSSRKPEMGDSFDANARNLALDILDTSPGDGG